MPHDDYDDIRESLRRAGVPPHEIEQTFRENDEADVAKVELRRYASEIMALSHRVACTALMRAGVAEFRAAVAHAPWDNVKRSLAAAALARAILTDMLS